MKQYWNFVLSQKEKNGCVINIFEHLDMQLLPIPLGDIVQTLFDSKMFLSQSAPGLGCGCLRIGFGRGHGCTARFEKTYFNY